MIKNILIGLLVLGLIVASCNCFVLKNELARELNNHILIAKKLETKNEQLTETIGALNIANAEIEDLKDNRPGRQFLSLDELEVWLDKNQVDKNKLIPRDYDCDDFAFDLMEDAFRDGYRIGLFAVDHPLEGHLANLAIIGNDVYYIEPTNDIILYWGVVDND